MAEMTSKERYLCCLNRETPDKVPILHWSLDLAQALSGVPMHQFAFDPEKMALGTIRYVEKYKPDVTSVNYDVFHQLEPYGLEVHITDSLIYPKKTLANRMRPDPKIYEELEYRSPFAGKRTQVYRKACQIVTEKLGDEVCLQVRGIWADIQPCPPGGGEGGPEGCGSLPGGLPRGGGRGDDGLDCGLRHGPA
jgi:uroporphyrinogen-III decarboxylase